MSLEHQLKDDVKAEEIGPPLQRKAGPKEYPLSLNQQHMWFQSQLDLESSLWNLGARMSVSGPLDVATFVQAVQGTVDRHEILRTVFTVSPDDVPVQQVIEHVDVKCPVRDLAPDLSPRDLENKVWTLMAALADPVYDLAAGPLFRAELLRASATQHYFIFAFHHLILDAFYSGQLMKEIISGYDLLRRGCALPETPSLQYGDFCVSQQQRWSQGLMKDTVAFWEEQLREPLPDLGLLIDSSAPFPRPVKSQVSLHLRQEAVRSLAELGKEARTTLFRVVLTILAVFFSRISRSNEVMLDIDFSTRPREMGHTIGFFANLLPVRLQVQEERTFRELVREVDSQLRRVTANREFPVRQLTRKLKGRRDAMQPLSPVVITQLGVLDWSLGGVHVNGSIYVTASIHDFWLGVMERDDDLEIILAYPDEVVDSDAAREWVSGMEKLIEQVLAQPDISLSQLLSSSQRDLDGSSQPVKSDQPQGSHLEEVTVEKWNK